MELTKFNKGVRPHGAADAFGVIGDDKLLLQLIQETESQDIGVVCGAHHQVSNTQSARKAETHTNIIAFHALHSFLLTETLGNCN